MKKFKLSILCILAILTLVGQKANAEAEISEAKLDRLMNETVCRNSIRTQCVDHCSNYCGKKFDGKANRDCVTKNCAGFAGYCNMALMGNDENLPGTLETEFPAGSIPEEFYVHLKDYEKCVAGDPGEDPRNPGTQWSEGIEDALGK